MTTHFPIATAILAASLMPALAGAASVRNTVKTAMPSIVEIHVLDESGKAVGGGSGIVVGSNGIVVTNYHVIDKATRARVVLGDGESVRVLGIREMDPERDFAILQIEAGGLPVAALGDSDKLESGDEVIAIGAPLGLSKTTTVGIVSQIRRMESYRMIQHTAAISPGSSGGPLLNERGQVIGINTFYLDKGQALYFALPINYIKHTLANLPRQYTSLSEVAAAREALEQKQRQKAAEGVIADNFYRYEDPDGLFTMTLPKVWRIQRSVEADREGNVTVVFMASDPAAEHAKIKGWLSAGIRIRVILPKRGAHWPEATQLAWAKEFLASSLTGYTKFVPAEPAQTEWSGRRGAELIVAGTAAHLSQAELAGISVVPGADALIAIELSVPAENKDLFELLHAIFLKSFTLAS